MASPTGLLDAVLDRMYAAKWLIMWGLICWGASVQAQTCANTGLGANCTRSNFYHGEILPNSGCGNFTQSTNYGPGRYFRIPVLLGGCYTVSTCGATTDLQLGAFQGAATTGPFSYDDDNGPDCTGNQASIVMVPSFTDYANVDVRQYNCLLGGTASITVKVRQNNNLTFTSVATDMCQGSTRTLTATPARVGTSPQPNSGDVGTFTGTGVSGTTFTAPIPSANSQVYTQTYTFGYCSTTQNITVFKTPSAAVAEADKIVCPGTAAISATAPAVGTGIWSIVSGTGLTIANANSASTTVSGLPASGSVTLRWTVSNGPCSTSSDDLVLSIGTLVSTPSAATVCEGNNASFVASASGPTDSLRWFRSTNAGSTWLRVGNGGGTTGATTGTLNFGPVAIAHNANLFRLQAYSCGSTTPVSSASATLTVAREANITGLGTNITDGDITPSATDGTDFGTVSTSGSVTRSFVIQNLGFTNLALTSITSNSARFVISNPGMPASLAPGTSYTFNVIFSPTAIGSATANITVNNDDCFEGVYDFAVQGVGAKRFYVDHTAVGANNGTSWANAFTSFQSAVALAASGDTVLVAKGTHLPQAGASRKKKFTLVEGVRYYGGFPNGGGTFAQRDFTANRTILSGDIGAANDTLDNCFLVVDATNLTNATLMSGFTIERGNADSTGFHLYGQAGGLNLGATGGIRMDSLTFRNNFGRSAGAVFGQGSTNLVIRGCSFLSNNSQGCGAAYIDTGNFTVLNSQFQSNRGANGGAMLFNGAGNFTNVSFLNNRSTSNGGAINGAPGSTFTSCTFTSNVCTSGEGGALYRFGGTAPTFTDCAFSQNSSLRGGAICSINGGVNLTRCSFRENTATTQQGGAFYNNIGTCSIINCVFWKNTAPGTGGAIYNNTGGTCNLNNCTFGGNTTGSSVGGAYTNNSTSNANIVNCIFWGNVASGNDGPSTSEISHGTGTLNISYTIWQGNNTGGTLYNCNPYFINPTTGDLRLQPCSNAIEIGTATGAPTNDLLGAARPFNGDAAGNAGYDLGAYESQSVCNPVVWYVDQTAVGCNNGFYWADAFTDLKSALRVAGAGDSIFVAAGTYKPDQGTNSRDSSFVLRSSIVLLGGFPSGGSALAARNWTGNPTRLSGAIGTAAATDNSYHVVKATSVNSTTLDGFYIQDGYANGTATLDQQGGGLSQVASYVTSRYISFENNYAQVRGGGAFHDAGGNPTYNAVRFANNSSDKGGGAYFIAASFVQNAIFRNNNATTYGGGLCMVVNQNVNHSTFKDNNAPSGAGVYFESGGSNKLHNCILWGNTGGQDVQGTGQIDIRYSIVEDGTPANCVGCGQIFVTNPQFTNADGFLAACSPAVDAGNALLPNLPAKDFLGNNRPLDGDGLNGAAYDLGAFESTLSCNVTRLYVDSSAVTGANLGTSWPDAYTSLQSAIANAGPGDTIYVAKGNYFPSNIAGRAASFVLNNVMILGGFPSGGSPLAGRNPATNPTVLNGNIGAATDSLDNCYHVVTVVPFTGPSGCLDGLTITRGVANGGSTNDLGAGIYCVNSSPRLINCLITRNTAANGGGGYFESSEARLIRVRFERNWGRGTGAVAGAGVSLAGANSADFVRCIFKQNQIFNAGGFGAAVSIETAVGAYFQNCEFQENTTNNGPGGAVRISQGNATAFFTNCLFQGNNAGTGSGGALIADANCTATLNNCTFYGNQSASNSAVYVGNTGAIVTANNSLFGSNSDQAFRQGGTLSLNSCVYPVATCPAGATCTNLLPVAPGFVAPPANLRLAPSSPALNIGTNAFVPVDVYDVDADLDISERTPDLDLNPRVFGVNVDVGAYELQCLPALVGTHPNNANVCPNGSVTFSATIVNTPDSLRWQVSTNGGGTWSLLPNGGPVSGATTASLTINPASASLNGYQYRLLVYSCGALSATSNAATLSSADLVPPTAICRPATVYLNASGSGTLAASQVNNGSSDGCGAVTLSVSPATFACAQVGAQAVTLTVTDGSSNTATCTATVSVLDTVRPVITCANPTIYLNASGTASLSAAVAASSATDNCAISSGSVSPGTFDCGDAFSNRLIWSAGTNLRRANTNGTAQQDFLSFPSTQVTMALVASKDSIYFGDFTARKIRRVHIAGGAITDIKTNVDPFGIAVDHLAGKIYWADPSANTISRCDLNGGNTQVLISGPADTDYSRMLKLDLVNGKMYWTDANQGFIKRANLDGSNIQTLITGMGNIVGLALDPVGGKMYYNSYSFSDIRRANLDGTGVQVIVPSTTLPLGMDLDLAAGKLYWASGTGGNAVYSCNLNGSAQTLVASGLPTPYDLAFIPPSPSTLTVTDVNGNSATCISQVSVRDTMRPVALCRPATVTLNAAGTGTLTTAAVDNGSTDNCGIFSSTLSSTTFTCAQVGTQTATLTVTDPSGNVRSCTAAITVQDLTQPTAICQNRTLNLSAAGTVSLTPAQINNGSSDACGIGSLSLNTTSFTCANVGSNTVTLTVTDVNGNSSTCNATVTIVDNTPPTALCQNQTLNLSAAGSATLTPAQINNGSSDACGIASLSLNTTTFSCANVGNNTVTLTVTDVNGNASTCTATVTIVDMTPPTALCQNRTVNLSAAGSASVSPAQINNGSSDACGIGSLALSQTAFTCANVGSNSVTLTVTDVNGNSSTCTATVTIVDNTPPTALCQNQTLNLNASGSASLTAAQINNGSSDACGIASLSVSPNAFTCANIGSNPVTLTVTDVNGNTSTCSASVTVVDNLAPTVTCANIDVHLDASGFALLPIPIGSAPTDNCGIASVGTSISGLSCANVGPNNVTVTATDPSGNSASCTAIVTVLDTVRPVATCQDLSIYLGSSGSASLLPADVNNGSSDACGIANMGLSQSTFGCADLGMQSVTLLVSDVNGNSSTCSAIITVLDTVGPAANCQATSIYLDNAGSATLSASQVIGSSTDACGIASSSVSPASFGCVQLGPNSVTLTLTDASGNTSTCTATVTVLDSIAPTAICSPATVTLDASGNGNISASAIGLGSSDNCTTFSASVSPSTFTCANLGANNVTLTLTDGSGNVSTCVANVTVLDVTPPVVVCNNATVYLDASGNGTIGASVVGLGTADACGSFTATLSPSSFTCANVGSNTVTFTATDPSGNSASCTASVSVLDTVRPVVVCQPATIYLNNTGTASLTVAQVSGGISDACGIASSTISTSSFACAHVGSNTVTLTATDVNGNSASCIASVSVLDTVRPVVTCQPATIYLDNTGAASLSVAQVNAGASDACGIASTTLSQSSFTCAHVGANTVTLTATDVNGNSAACTASVSVLDTVRPVVICQPATIYLDNAGAASLSVAQVSPGSSDACGVASSTLSQSSFTCAHVGANTVTLTSTDVNGNSASCTASVSVLDTVRPVVLCQPATIYLNNTGTASLTVAQVSGGISDACGIASSAISMSSFACANVGSNTVTLTATDVNGNSASCSASVSVLDTVRPVVVCQPATIYLDNTGAASLSVAQVNAGASDACGIASTTLSQSSFTCAHVGANTVTLTATDVNGNSAACTASVSVLDTVRPVVLCQPATIYLDNAGAASLTVAQVSPGSSDTCGVASSTLSQNSFTCAHVGANTVTLTSTDVNGNSASCTASVSVLDTVRPVVLCQPATIYLDNTGTASLTVAQVSGGISDACGIANSTISTSSFACANVGSNTVTLSATDVNGNSASCIASVSVLDTVRPVVVCQPATIYLDNAGTASLSVAQVNAGASDACGIASTTLSQSSFTCAHVGANTVTLTATDVNGNSAACTASVSVLDTVRPVVICQPATIYLDNAGAVSLSVAQVNPGSSDACGVASSTLSQSSFTCAHVGANTVTLTSTDVNGNSASCIASVSVLDTVRPIVICQPATIYLNNTGTASLTVAQVSGGISDACGIASSTISTSSFACAHVGSNTVTLSATDVNGNSASCSASVSVLDTVRPVVVCQPATIYLDNAGTASLSVAQVSAGASDACGIASTTLSQSSFTCVHVGANTVTLTTTDVNGNSAFCTATVTVIDSVHPVVTCQSATLYLNAAGSGTLAASQVHAGSSDACGQPSLSVSPNTFACANVGSNSVLLSATDINGNASTCTATVTVLDTVRPQAICQFASIFLDATGTVTILPSRIDANSNDACGIATRSISQSTFTCANLGSNTVTLTVTDVNGNSNLCNTVVVVRDTVRPVVLCQPATVYLNAAGTGSLAPASIDNGSFDACGIVSLVASMANFTCAEVGANSVNLTATDVRNNTGTCTTTVTVIDTVRPNAVCQPANVYLDASGQATINASIVDGGSSDACGITGRTASPTNFACAQVGPNTVTLSLTDVNGNQVQCSTTVTVIDTVRPNAQCQPATVYLDAQGAVNISGSTVDAGSADACGIGGRSVSPQGFGCQETGSNPVLLTITDTHGNSQQCSTTVTVLDTVRPNAICQPLTIYLDALGAASTTATAVDNGSNDACGIDTLVLNTTSFGCGDVGSVQLTLSATDLHGNTSTCSSSVTVMDTVAPALACQSATLALGSQGQVSLSTAAVTTWATDACGVDTLLLSQDLFSCADTGQNYVTVTAVDLHGNQRSCIAEVTVVPDPFVVQLSALTLSCGYNVSCVGAQDGTAQASPGGGCAPYTYAWSTGGSTAQISGIGAGTYWVTVTDGIGRVFVDSVVVTAPALLLPNAIAATTVCGTDTSGNVDLSPAGGNGCQGYSFLWHNGATTEDITGLGAGTWSVTVTDPFGCQGQQSGLITSTPLPQPNLGANVLKCTEDMVTLNPGGFFAYLWSNGSTSNTTQVGQAGTYWVLVTDSVGCAATDTIVVSNRPTQHAFVTATGPSPMCIGDTAVLNAAGPGFSSYLWSNGATSAAIQVSGTGGTFTVTATDNFGCENVDSSAVIFFNAPKPNPTILPSGTVSLCTGGTVVLDASPGYFSYQWTTGGSTSQITVASPGTYAVTVSNGFGCVGTSAPVTVVQVPLPQPTISFANDTLRTDPIWLAYQWFLNGAPIPGATLSYHVPQQDGIYSVIVVNGNNCAGESVDLHVQLVAAEDEHRTIHGLSLYPNPARGNFYLTTLRPIDWNLTVTITDMFGRRLKQYQMAHLVHDTGFDISDLAAGPYLIEIETEKGQRKMFRLVVQ